MRRRGFRHKVYNKAEGVGDISRVRVIDHQSVSQGIPTKIFDIYTKCIPIRCTSGLYVRYKQLAVYICIAKHMQSTGRLILTDISIYWFDKRARYQWAVKFYVAILINDD